MEKLTRYHIKHIQSVAEGVISEYTVNTLIRTNGSTSFVMTFKEKESSPFLFFEKSYCPLEDLVILDVFHSKFVLSV